MAKIVFRTIEYKNFRSVGNKSIKIDLDKHKTTLICGENGTGKTTVISALCFALFGRGYGSGNKPDLINTINLKQLLTTVEFDIGSKKIKVIRGIKPNIFEIYENSVLINIDPHVKDYQKVLEQQILKFNYRAFTQVVAVSGGEDYTPFMRLATKDRREFVEDLLDIRVFSHMSSLLKDQTKFTKEEVKDINAEMKSKKEKIYLQESFIQKMEKEKTSSSDKILASISILQDSNKVLGVELEKETAKLMGLQLKVNEYHDFDEQLTDSRIKGKQLKSVLDKKVDDVEQYSHMQTCPTCFQNVDDHHKENIIMQLENEASTISADVLLHNKTEHKIKVMVDYYTEYLQSHADAQKVISDIHNQIFSNNTSIKNANRQLSEMQSDVGNISTEKDILKGFAVEYIELVNRKKELLSVQQYQELQQQILSDSGIRSKVIKQYIPTINKLINKYLTELDFFVSFHLDESFTETIKSRHRDTFTYGHFSEGQKRRIDLAILLAWVDIAKAKNALWTNICFFDEIDAPLDASGSDMLHSTLKACSSENIFLISHKSDIMADKVDHTITFRLHNNFTEVV